MVNREIIVSILLSIQTCHYGVFYIDFKCQFFVSLFFRLIWFIRQAFGAYRIYTKFVIGFEMLNILEDIIDYVSTTVCGIILIRSTNYIRYILNERIYLLTKKNYFKIILMNVLFIFYRIWTFTNLMSDGHLKKHFDKSFSIINKVNFYLFEVLFIYDLWIVTTVCVYILIFYLIHFSKTNAVKKMEMSVNYYDWLNLLVNFKSEHSQFENFMSLYPSLWLLYSFVGSAGLIERLKNRDLNFILIYLSGTFPWILAVLIVAMEQDTLHTYINKLRLNIYSCKLTNPSLKMAINALMTELIGIKVTASSVISLEKSLFLPCIGYIITYTLLLQEKFSRATTESNCKQ